MTLNISSYVGAIMMVGIVGENAIFVIHEGRVGAGATERRRRTAWARAARRRLRPVAMTILATRVRSGATRDRLGVRAPNWMQPLAVAVIGGFALSAPLVLVVLPALYAAVDPRGRLAGESEPT